MAEVVASETVDIEAPLEAAYAIRLDFTHLPEYNPNVSNLKRIDGGTEPGVGATYEFHMTFPGMDPMPNTLTVTEADPYSRVVCEIDAGGGIKAREICTFERTAGGTHIEFEGTVFMPGELDDATRSAIAQTTHEQDRLELDLIKKILEG